MAALYVLQHLLFLDRDLIAQKLHKKCAQAAPASTKNQVFSPGYRTSARHTGAMCFAFHPLRLDLRMFAALSLLAGAVILAAQPAWWLLGTWLDSGYDGVGWLAFAWVCGLGLWSLSSDIRDANPSRAGSRLRPLGWLALAAVLRFASQLLDINVLGALLLAVDVFALAKLGRLEHRARPVSPLWLAGLFCFSLPVEPMAQRLVGYDLQLASAALACGMLSPFVQTLSCEGIRLVADGRDVLVDLPCSGAELLSLSAMIFCGLNAVSTPKTAAAVLGALFTLAAGLLLNGARIAVLALGIVHADSLPFDVMAPLPHTAIGLAAVGLLSGALCWFKAALPARDPDKRVDAPPGRPTPQWMVFEHRAATAAGFLFLPLALFIGAVQPQPVDVSPRLSPPEMPRVAAGFLREPQPLTAQERRYFEQYGGSASRAAFGPFGLLLVTTASPLRHLHDPTICLRGAGFDVRLLGTDHPNVSTLYRAERSADSASSVQQQSYVVSVTYVSADGRQASSIAEVVRHWLRRPDTRWTMVQRVIPERAGIDPDLRAEWDAAVRRAVNLSVHVQSIPQIGV